MQELVVNFLDQYGYFGIGLLMALENVFPPIPSEIILTFGGFLTTYTEMQPFFVILSATIGSVSGALILYFVGHLISIQSLSNMLDGKIGQALHLKPTDLNKAVAWFAKRGNQAVFFCRFVPIVRSLISIPAGTAHMNLATFLILTTVGTAIWNTVLVFFGAFAGDSWVNIVKYMDTYTILAIVLMGIIFMAILYKLYKQRFKRS